MGIGWVGIGHTTSVLFNSDKSDEHVIALTKTLKLSSPGEWRHCNGWNNGDIVRHCTLGKQVYRLKRNESTEKIDLN